LFATVRDNAKERTYTVTDASDAERESLEAKHPIIKNAGRKGLGCGIVAVVVAAIVGFVVWSFSPLAPIGVAYSAVGAIPWLIGAGAVLLVVRIVTRRK
jgi:hypothetical protein